MSFCNIMAIETIASQKTIEEVKQIAQRLDEVYGDYGREAYFSAIFENAHKTT